MKPNPSATATPAFPEAGLPERLGPPDPLDAAQQAAADALINGPRGGIYGPFRPLLHRPPLLQAIARVGETLRFEGRLDTALREWTICVVAREASNVFEWDMHLPLAEAAGVPPAALAAVERGAPTPADLRSDLALARLVVRELLTGHRLSEETYGRSLSAWGEPETVELLTLVGYFAMVCWLMNVARTPGPQSRGG
ncbi:carboxymuconolactone decarboxylase family protein [Methylobacterium planeticum]|uniref:Carboxymuconolactone decarboxylase family protein n=1 Tax=Methylobacterium planeticum TaxID=2615211 RepID=A0A6N6MGD0_9HYPH|nr:carboxymuconolactone decarboxylase family protein [Methylobacterium planeticum]KAB1069908.1 carboxymuconolactone decarboxylase family protein [Methylobacterium planeticum]